MKSLFWLYLKVEPGMLEYVEGLQAELGGVIQCSDGWYWLDQIETSVKESK